MLLKVSPVNVKHQKNQIQQGFQPEPARLLVSVNTAGCSLLSISHRWDEAAQPRVLHLHHALQNPLAIIKPIHGMKLCLSEENYVPV